MSIRRIKLRLLQRKPLLIGGITLGLFVVYLLWPSVPSKTVQPELVSSEHLYNVLVNDDLKLNNVWVSMTRTADNILLLSSQVISPRPSNHILDSTEPKDIQIEDKGGEREDGGAKQEHDAESEKPPQSERMPVVAHGEADIYKQTKVREMILHAWKGYETYAFGANEFKPIAKVGHQTSIFGGKNFGATIVDSIDLLFISGLTDEYQRARKWILEEFNFTGNYFVSVFEVNIRFVGGLLAIHGLTGDAEYLKKAVQVADKLLPAFDTPTGIPHAMVNLETGQSKNWGWASGGSSILAEFGTLSLEMRTLSHVTGDKTYADHVNKVMDLVISKEKTDGLYPNYINPTNGAWGMQHISLGALGDSFYEYLIKLYLMTGEKKYKTAFNDVVQAIEKHLVRQSRAGNWYVNERKSGRLMPKMDHLACFIGGMFGIGAQHTDVHFLAVGERIADTCHLSYNKTATGLGPEAFHFEGQAEAVALRANEKIYIQRPEVVESWFVLWRLTKNQRYRDWAWDMVQSLEKYSRVENGYSGIRDVYSVPVGHDDVQQSFFLAETLKYLYLIFSDDDTISLDKYVFNTEAHPLLRWT